MSQIELYFLHSTSVLSFHIDVVLPRSIDRIYLTSIYNIMILLSNSAQWEGGMIQQADMTVDF